MSALLVLVVLAVVQLTLALYVRTTVLDAAAEGARQASLADARPTAAEQRTGELLDAALGAGYDRDIAVTRRSWHGRAVVEVTVRAPLPIVGLLGPDRGLEVTGHAALEQLP